MSEADTNYKRFWRGICRRSKEGRSTIFGTYSADERFGDWFKLLWEMKNEDQVSCMLDPELEGPEYTPYRRLLARENFGENSKLTESQAQDALEMRTSEWDNFKKEYLAQPVDGTYTWQRLAIAIFDMCSEKALVAAYRHHRRSHIGMFEDFSFFRLIQLGYMVSRGCSSGDMDLIDFLRTASVALNSENARNKARVDPLGQCIEYYVLTRFLKGEDLSRPRACLNYVFTEQEIFDAVISEGRTDSWETVRKKARELDVPFRGSVKPADSVS